MINKKYICPVCKSQSTTVKKKGAHNALYCADCGRWIKWLSKLEFSEYVQAARVFMQCESSVSKEKSSNVVYTNSDYGCQIQLMEVSENMFSVLINGKEYKKMEGQKAFDAYYSALEAISFAYKTRYSLTQELK